MEASGVSQSAFRLTTYVNAVDPIAQVYDGFFVHSRAGAGAPLTLPPQPGGANLLTAQPVRFRPDLRVPVLALQTETDVVALGCAGARQDDTERFRLWELAGSAHADTYLMAGRIDTGSLAPGDLAAALAPTTSAIGMTFARPINSGPQHHYVANAAVHHLDRWVQRPMRPCVPGSSWRRTLRR